MENMIFMQTYSKLGIGNHLKIAIKELILSPFIYLGEAKRTFPNFL